MNDEIIEVPSEKLTPADERLEALFDEMEKGSLEALESAARQIITLCTTLLAAFWGILAFKDMPVYITCPDVKSLTVAALVSFFIALAFALRVVLPRHHLFHRADLTGKRTILHNMLKRKRTALRWAAWFFGFAAFMMLITALDVLIFHL
ncbi:hypothetical protein GX408_03315 [bacterium]|nr:hypothetical protein [bacterium]